MFPRSLAESYEDDMTILQWKRRAAQPQQLPRGAGTQ